MPHDTSRNDKNFRGSGHKLSNAVEYVTGRAIYFGNKTVPAGTKVKQFETLNFGWTAWIDPDGNHHLARE